MGGGEEEEEEERGVLGKMQVGVCSHMRDSR